MKQFYLTIITIIITVNGALSQCTVEIPPNAIVADVPTGLSGANKHVWICDSLSHSGFDHFFYIEDGGYTSGSGIGITSWVKDGGLFNSSGIDDTVYYENIASLLSMPDVAIQCPTITFDYINAPPQGCVVSQPPTANINASADTICAGGTCIDFMDNSITTGTTTWDWSFPGGIPSSSTDQNPTSICYAMSGTYTAQLTVNDQVGNDTATYTIHVLNCTGIYIEEAMLKFSIDPNPASSSVRVSSQKGTGIMEFFDITGQRVMVRSITSTHMDLDISHFSSGTYFVQYSIEHSHGSIRRLIVD